MEPNAPSNSFSDADLEDSKDLDRRFVDAINRKDLDATMACLWDDPGLVFILDGVTFKGTEAVRGAIRNLFEAHEELGLEVNEVSHVPSGDAIIGVGTATYHLKPKEGPPRLMIERWSDMRRKVNGKWVYALDHTTQVDK